MISQLALVGALVVINALFAGTELALVSLREGQLQRLETQGRRGATLARLARDPNRFLATIQIGITLAGFLASAAAAVSLAEPLEEPLSFLGDLAGPASIVLVTLILAYVTLVFGELAPKRLAMQRAERWGMLAARPLSVVETLTRPAVHLLSFSTNLVVRVLGGDPHQRGDEVSAEELRQMVATRSELTLQQRRIIDGAFEVSERNLREVLRPRREVLWFDAARTASDAMVELVDRGHSRAPVVHTSLDDVVGVVHLRDLVGAADRPVGELAREVVAFPESAGVLDSLRRLQSARQQLAIVIDEHGATEGIVTVEDLVEELVGEIYDESDRDVRAVVRRADDTLVLPGTFPVHDLVDLGVVLAEEELDGDYTTVAGLVLEHLGHLPNAPGERVEVDGWRFEVTGLGRRAISEVTVRAVEPGDPEPQDERPADRAIGG
ncbi:MAG TPA: hemolysin family protein [Acidimicrobiales bacterium]|nr:hemolysin family protein [Acidimicrobiales bacterium]